MFLYQYVYLGCWWVTLYGKERGGGVHDREEEGD